MRPICNPQLRPMNQRREALRSSHPFCLWLPQWSAHYCLSTIPKASNRSLSAQPCMNQQAYLPRSPEAYLHPSHRVHSSPARPACRRRAFRRLNKRLQEIYWVCRRLGGWRLLVRTQWAVLAFGSQRSVVAEVAEEASDKGANATKHR